MKRKILVTILSLAMGLSIVACGKQETTATTESVPTTVESTQAETTVTEESKVELLPWLQLASLETHPELRTVFEELLGVTVSEDGTKTGIIYTDETGKANQNNTLFNALGKNNLFIDTI